MLCDTINATSFKKAERFEQVIQNSPWGWCSTRRNM